MHEDTLTRVNNFMEHFGVKGMKWGVRRRDGSDGDSGSNPTTKKGGSDSDASKTDAQRAREIHAKARKSGIGNLSNEEMQTLVTRMSLEAKYSQITKQQGMINRGREFVNRQMKTGKTVNDLISFANSPAGNLIASSLRGPSGKWATGAKAGRRIKAGSNK